MFTGIIERTGQITKTAPHKLWVHVPKLKAKAGDSLAINGVCLTVVRKGTQGAPAAFEFDLLEETLRRTTLRQLRPGTQVNVEPALTLAQALGGHIVQGHVDGVGRVAKVSRQKGGKRIWFHAPSQLHKYLVEKGSVAIDGVSLTVAGLSKDLFSVSLIPFTLKQTNLDGLQVGDKVNIEADIIAKYVAKYRK